MKIGQWWMSTRGTLVCINEYFENEDKTVIIINNGRTLKEDLTVLIQGSNKGHAVQLPHVPAFLKQEH